MTGRTELQMLINSLRMRPYIPPTTEVVILAPGVPFIARGQRVDVLLPVMPSVVNPAVGAAIEHTTMLRC
jgi:hypothetical protein